MSFTGQVQNGAVVLDEPVKLPDGTAVEVDVRPVGNRGGGRATQATAGECGLCYEGTVLVHRGTNTPSDWQLETERDERMGQLSQGLPR
jgi:hypothetical protein